MRQVVSVLLLFLLPACTVGNTYDYRTAPELRARSSGTVAVGVHDKRLYIVSNDKQPDFVGLQRGGFGNPFEVTTRSGAALADDFAQTIVDALSRNGIAASTVALSPQDGRKAAMQTMAGTGAERAIFVTLDEWKSDNFINVALVYNLSAEVFDSQGKVLAETRRQGRDALGAGLGETIVGNLVADGYMRILGALLNDERIVAALGSAPPSPKVAEVPAKPDSMQTPASTQSAEPAAQETSEADRERVTWFIRNNENKVKSRLASYNASNHIGGDANLANFKILTIDDILVRTVEGDRANVALGFASGYRTFPRYHQYRYDVQLSSGDIVILGHQKP